jgi:hypothetical protein
VRRFISADGVLMTVRIFVDEVIDENLFVAVKWC